MKIVIDPSGCHYYERYILFCYPYWINPDGYEDYLSRIMGEGFRQYGPTRFWPDGFEAYSPDLFT